MPSNATNETKLIYTRNKIHISLKILCGAELLLPISPLNKMDLKVTWNSDIGGVRKERSEGLEYHQRISHGQGCVEACYPCVRTMIGCKILWVSPIAYPNLFGTKYFVVVVKSLGTATPSSLKGSILKTICSILLL
jgi:hypothetical protein